MVLIQQPAPVPLFNWAVLELVELALLIHRESCLSTRELHYLRSTVLYIALLWVALGCTFLPRILFCPSPGWPKIQTFTPALPVMLKLCLRLFTGLAASHHLTGVEMPPSPSLTTTQTLPPALFYIILFAFFLVPMRIYNEFIYFLLVIEFSY